MPSRLLQPRSSQWNHQREDTQASRETGGGSPRHPTRRRRCYCNQSRHRPRSSRSHRPAQCFRSRSRFSCLSLSRRRRRCRRRRRRRSCRRPPIRATRRRPRRPRRRGARGAARGTPRHPIRSCRTQNAARRRLSRMATREPIARSTTHPRRPTHPQPPLRGVRGDVCGCAVATRGGMCKTTTVMRTRWWQFAQFTAHGAGCLQPPLLLIFISSGE